MKCLGADVYIYSTYLFLFFIVIFMLIMCGAVSLQVFVGV